MNVIRTISQAIFGVVSPVSVETPATGQAMIGISDITKRLYSVDDNGVVTTYGATGEYNDFVNGRIVTYFQDFLNIALMYPLSVTLIGGTGVTALNAVAGRNGILSINKGVTVNNGAYVMSNINAVILSGGQYFEAWIRQDYQAGVTARVGFHNAVSITEPTDGAFFNIVGGVVAGKCMNASSTSSTTTYAMTLGAWYKLKITVNAAAASVTFEIRDASEAVVLSEALTTNIPTASIGFGFEATESSGVAHTGILVIDTMRVDL